MPVISPAKPDGAHTGQSHAAFRLCEWSACLARQISVSSCPDATLKATLQAPGRQQHSRAQASWSQCKPCAECAVLDWEAIMQEPHRKFVVHVASERVHLSAQLAGSSGLMLPALELRARWRQHLHSHGSSKRFCKGQGPLWGTSCAVWTVGSQYIPHGKSNMPTACSEDKRPSASIYAPTCATGQPSCPLGTGCRLAPAHCSYHAPMLGICPVSERGALRHQGRLPLAGVQGQACHAAPLNLIRILHCLQHVIIDAPGSLPQGIQRLIDLQWESADMSFTYS